MEKSIYLDNNATTRCDPRVVDVMLPYFSEIYGNPSNGYHQQGRTTAKAVNTAREKVASLINASAGEIFFTSGATESDNLSILGVARAESLGKRNRIVTSLIEHKAILEPCNWLHERGFDVVYLPVDEHGVVVLDAAREVIDEKTLLVSIQLANNETGVLQPIKQIAEFAHEHGAWLHTDAAQAVGKISVDVSDLDVDLLSISAHKFYGPKGIGALYINRAIQGSRIMPLTYGGGQEKGIRPGTLNVPGIVGLGMACELAENVLVEEGIEINRLRNFLEECLEKKIAGLRINGKNVLRLPNTSSLFFPDVDADVMLLNMPNLMLGTGSACTSGAIEPSHVLQAMGISRQDAHRVIRVSLGRYSTFDEINTASIVIYDTWAKCVGT
ncbi:MAG TPA: cysteine desulfurase family protein [Anaerolineaceae bacterium]|nr:cysteine desulfurase family protein [Anaerolineaceae bacterium]